MSETAPSVTATETTSNPLALADASKKAPVAVVPAAQRGKTSIAEQVVAKIAGIATREIGGVYDVGGATERIVGKVRDVLPGTTTSTTQGINVEVGERQAAVDVSLVAEYGVAIHQLAAAVRRNVVTAIEQMTGLEVTEVNVTVHDIHFGEENDAPDTARVQ
ncbi:MAG: Asp23/Gls24 family envelope stress response protein [Gordonia sp. (in: high G+C Gram-positive bacteria)]